ncbi:hypothetical protein BDN72DRAFT_901682, partial [Pluteus cervinus]
LRFRRSEEPSFIKFGRTADRDLQHNIRSGQIKLEGTIVADFFQPSIDCIIKVILEHRRDHNVNVTSPSSVVVEQLIIPLPQTVFLVGGFAASDWLFHKVQAAVKSFNIDVCRPDNHVNKAVADGAVSFFVDHFVSTRVSKFDYGTNSTIPYMPWKASHRARSDKQFKSLSGQMVLPEAFDVILPKDTRVTEEQEFQEQYYNQSNNKLMLEHLRTRILRYRGARDTIEWMDEDEDNFEVMCTIEADTSLASRALVPHRGSDGRMFYALRFKIILLFGLTEFRAQFCWTENGEEKRDLQHNIRSGQIKLEGTTVADFFQPSIDCIIKAILEHRRDHNINTVFLVGGFAASDWLFHRVQAAVKSFNIDVCRITWCKNKAVADGAVSFFIDHFVSTRVSKFDYGTTTNIEYMPWKSSHRARTNQIFKSVSGEILLPDAFANTSVSEQQEFRQYYYRQGTSKASMNHLKSTVLRYRGARETIQWADEDEDNLEVMCTIEADTSLAGQALMPQKGSDGQMFYALNFDIVLLFGLTEFKAQICWKENGEEKRGPARVIYSTE